MGVGKIADSLFLRLSEQGDGVWQQVLDAWNVNVSPPSVVLLVGLVMFQLRAD